MTGQNLKNYEILKSDWLWISLKTYCLSASHAICKKEIR